jgi:DNA-binding SARP family transcriptional activator
MHSETPTDTTTYVRLLGPVGVQADGVARVVSGVRRKAVLAALAMHAGDTVRTERLIDIVWGEAPPATAANTLQSHISFLHRVLGAEIPVVTRSFGYVLAIAPDSVDALRADRLIRHVIDDGDDPVARLRRALDLWRGHSLVDVAKLPWFQEQAERLENLRLEGVAKRNELRLGRGEDSALVPELEGLIERYPLREEVHRQLILALYHSGRQVESLAAFRRLRQILDEELGIEPSAPLRELEVAIQGRKWALQF